MDVIEGKSEIKEEVIGKDNINDFILPDYHRKIRKKMIQRISSSLEAQKMFEDPITVNVINGKKRIIDGGHRMLSVKKFLEGNPDSLVKVKMDVFKELSDEEEKEVYDLISKRLNETFRDYVKIHSEEIPVLKSVEKKFPVAIGHYTNRNTMNFGQLIKIWITREDTIMTSGSREALLTEAKSWTGSDYQEMYSFFQKYSEIFGLPTKDNSYYKTGPIWVVASIYYRNRGVINTEKLWNIIRTKLYKNPRVLELVKASGRDFVAENRRVILTSINRSWRGTPLV